MILIYTYIDGVYFDHLGFPDSSEGKNVLAMQKTQETQLQSLVQEYPLEKEMAAHSGIIAGTIPRTEQPGGLQSTESQRVENN